MKRIVILGAGTGGTMTANRLRRRYGADEAEIHVVDRDDRHAYQPGLLFVPFGLADPDKLVRSRRGQLRDGIAFHESEIERVSLDDDEVVLASGETLPYDVLVVASGTALQPEETEGLVWSEAVQTFYELERAVALRDALARFDGGRLVVDIVDLPIKCPVAPIEFVFLADWWLRGRGLRDRSEIVLATPLDGCFTKPIAAEHLSYLLAEKRIDLQTEFSAGEVDGSRLVSYDGRELLFDLLVAVPLHGGAPTSRGLPAWATRWGSCPRTRTRCRRKRGRTSSRWGTRPTCRRPRPGRPSISRASCWSRTSFASSPAASRRPRTTGTSTASSRPASARRC